MRLIAGLLLVINVTLFMWAYWHKDPVPPAVTRRPEVMPEKLRIITEPGVTLVPRPKAPVKNSPRPVLLDTSGCYRIGPFPTESAVTAAGAQLTAQRIAYTRVTESETMTAWRVTLGPLASKAAAERKRNELHKQGIGDSALLPEDERVIALGIFTVEANATKRVRALAARKIAATLTPVVTTRGHRYWLALTEPARDGKIGDVPLPDLARLRFDNAAALESRACEPPAPATGDASR